MTLTAGSTDPARLTRADAYAALGWSDPKSVPVPVYSWEILRVDGHTGVNTVMFVTDDEGECWAQHERLSAESDGRMAYWVTVYENGEVL